MWGRRRVETAEDFEEKRKKYKELLLKHKESKAYLTDDQVFIEFMNAAPSDSVKKSLVREYRSYQFKRGMKNGRKEK